jgi:site-specific DNA recombinase
MAMPARAAQTRSYLNSQTSATAGLTRAAMAEMAASGLFPGCAPTGYRNAIFGTGRKSILPDPILAPLVLEAFVLVDTGSYTIRELAAIMEAKGLRSRQGKVLGPSALWYLLRNPFYAGYVRWNGRQVRGAHQAIVSEELFWRVQVKLGGRGKS